MAAVRVAHTPEIRRTWLIVVVVCSAQLGCATATPTPLDASIVDLFQCGPAQTLCSSGCTETAQDPVNCGRCGNPCPAGQVCSKGSCSLECGVGTTVCGQSCVDINVDPSNCGGCGQICATGEQCSNGVCALVCAASQTLCPSSDAPYCAYTVSDNANCGSCGRVCALGLLCHEGSCSSSCGGDTLCQPDGGVPYCASTQTDNANCGSCGNTCAAGLGCSSGGCNIVCGGGTQLCGSVCVNLQSDPNHCGDCTNGCGATMVCSSGTCAALCSQGLTRCTNSCVDVTSDNSNCGVCGRTCSGGPTCVLGRCVTPYVYSDSFTAGTAPTAAQCTTWQSWVTGLGSNYAVMNLKGTFDTTGISCNDPTVVNGLASALRSHTSFTGSCSGHSWSYCNRSSYDEIWIDPPSQCSSSNCPSPGYIVRPCIGTSNVNWGGVNTATCGGPSQSITLTLD